MKKIIILLILFSFLISCKRKEQNFSKEMIEKLKVEDTGFPSYYLSFNLYVQTNNNEIHKTNNHELFAFYKQFYSRKFKTFNEFLEEVLNKDFDIDKGLFDKVVYLDCFKLNSKIENEYSALGFNEFLKKYSKKTSKKNAEFELNKSIIKQDEYLTIVYLLYKNRYDIGVDCYIGKDYIRKREESFK